MADLSCTVATPEGTVFEGKASSVVVPATDGELGILPRHAAVVVALGFGELRVDEAGGAKRRFFVGGGGFVQVLRDQVTVLATEAEPVESLKNADAAQRLEEALARRPAPGSPPEEIDAHAQAVREAKGRQKLAG